MSETLGVFGGTFSPPHRGHVRAAEVFLAAVKPDKLLIVPTFVPPHKAADGEASPEERLEMCRLAFGHLPHTEVSDIEIRRGGKSYTADTLAALSMPKRRIAFLCGTDMMLTLDEWHDPERIFELADLYCIRRESDPETNRLLQEKNAIYAARFGKEVSFLSAPVCEVSSSDIRREIQAGDRHPALLPDSVAAYINERGLYR